MKRLMVAFMLFSVVHGFAEPLPSNPETIEWGEQTNQLQLSITIATRTITTDQKLMVHFKARNLSSAKVEIDAGIPSSNRSSITVVYPDGTEGGLNTFADMRYSTFLGPGENDFGEFDVTSALDKWEYNAKKEGPGKYDLCRPPGVHIVTWILNGSRSNSVKVKVE